MGLVYGHNFILSEWMWHGRSNGLVCMRTGRPQKEVDVKSAMPIKLITIMKTLNFHPFHYAMSENYSQFVLSD